MTFGRYLTHAVLKSVRLPGVIWRRSRLRSLAGALAAAAVLAAACAGQAAAENRFIGSTPVPTSGAPCTFCTHIQLNSALNQASYVVPPGNWTVTSWSMAGGTTTPGMARAVIWRPDGVNGFRVVGLSAFETIAPNTVTPHTTSIPVQGGDILGRSTESAGDVPVDVTTAAGTDAHGLVATGNNVALNETAGFIAPPSTYGFSGFTPMRLLNINATLFRPGDGINPPLIGPNLSPPAAPATAAKLGGSSKKCKKGRKLRRGKCVRRKPKK